MLILGVIMRIFRQFILFSLLFALPVSQVAYADDTRPAAAQTVKTLQFLRKIVAPQSNAGRKLRNSAVYAGMLYIAYKLIQKHQKTIIDYAIKGGERVMTTLANEQSRKALPYLELLHSSLSKAKDLFSIRDGIGKLITVALIGTELSKAMLRGFAANNHYEMLKDSSLPRNVKEKVGELLGEITRVTTLARRAQIINHLDTINSLPWAPRRVRGFQPTLASVEHALNEQIYGMHNVKEAVLNYLALRRALPHQPGKILCLVGPPGVGKTTIASAIATALNRPFHAIALGGVHKESDIRGEEQTVPNAKIGCILNAHLQTRSKDPVILIDEIDKLGGSNAQGNPADALLEVFDPAQNKNFMDHYLELPYDCSGALYIVTANTEDNIPAPLLNRMEVIQCPGYDKFEQFDIAKRHIQKIYPEAFIVSDDALFKLMESCDDPGMRTVERALQTLFAKAVRATAAGLPRVITEENICELAGIQSTRRWYQR